MVNSFTAESGAGWKIVKKVVGIKDTGKGLIVDGAIELQDPKGEVYVRMISSSYAFGKYTSKDDGTEGYAKSIAPKQPVKAGKPPSRNPDHVVSEKTLPEQAMIYRLSGGEFPRLFGHLRSRLIGSAHQTTTRCTTMEVLLAALLASRWVCIDQTP